MARSVDALPAADTDGCMTVSESSRMIVLIINLAQCSDMNLPVELSWIGP